PRGGLRRHGRPADPPVLRHGGAGELDRRPPQGARPHQPRLQGRPVPAPPARGRRRRRDVRDHRAGRRQVLKPSRMPTGTTRVTIEELLRDAGADLELTLRAGGGGMSRTIAVPRIQKPGLALAGYEEQLHDERLLTLGGTEIEYLSSTTPAQRELGISTMMAASPACIVVTRGLEPPAELVAACEKGSVPLMVSRLVSAELIARVTRFLQERLSPSTSLHGVLLDVLGVGVLLLGKSGIGKSEAA